MIAQVAVFKSLGDFATLLSYAVPEKDGVTLRPGMLVRFKFRGRLSTGVVVSLLGEVPAGLDPSKLKPLETVYPLAMIPAWQMQAAEVLAQEYSASLSAFLKLFFPQRLRSGLPRAVPHSPAPFEKFPLKSSSFTLTAEQQKAIEVLRDSQKPVLLQGLTGSGKTEVYLQAILETVKQGKQALFLVPEISLTPQIIRYFKEAFGDHIALFHSHMTEAERLSEWWKVKSGFSPVVLGSRSAIFAPCENLGLIVIDEEHEWTYKQESSPYYHARRVAEVFAEFLGCKLLLGSATPCAESLLKVSQGIYAKTLLTSRISGVPLPTITVVDLRDEFHKKNFSIFSQLLQRKITEVLDRKEQVLLFVNQRGLFGAVLCRDCGAVETCPNCSISLKVHRERNGMKLLCHTCGFTKDSPLQCPSCQSPNIRHIGLGTQRLEEQVRSFFPQARVVRADSDTVSKKTPFETIYKDFLDRKYDILIGTQMIAKGLDFSPVGLVGILLADIGLHLPDYRSHERLFQLLIQVAGRTGRKGGGEVILQTYEPQHPAILKAAAYDVDGFMEEELSERKKLFYPPYCERLAIYFYGKDASLKTAQDLQKELNAFLGKKGNQHQLSLVHEKELTLFLRVSTLKDLDGFTWPKGVRLERDPYFNG